jgi:peptidyl-dipeptidase Dcp
MSEINNTDNPLLNSWNTPYNVAPFSKIKASDYKPAIEVAIEKTLEEVDAIVNDPSEPDFNNTIEALEKAGELVSRITPVLFNLNSAETSQELQAAAMEVSPLLAGLANDISLNAPLFKKIKKVWEQREKLTLTTEQAILLDRKYKSFVRGGASLADADKEKFRALTIELSTLSLQFEENLLAETNDFEMVLTGEADLEGLPEGIKEAAAIAAKDAGKEGWLFTLHFPSYVPFMQYSARRDLREKMYMAYSRRSFRGNEHDNREKVIRIVNLRLELARLLGYPDFATYVLEERMAGSPQRVNTFLNELLDASKEAGTSDVSAVEALARGNGFTGRFERWDWAFWSEKLKMKLYNIDDELLRPYMPLEKVQEAVLGLATRLYDITFIPNDDIPVYHPEVKPFEVKDDSGEVIALLMLDFHPRKGKSGGAWMTGYREQYRESGRRVIPVVSLVMNFTRPTPTRPALLSHSELTTFLHEFGHALHGMLTDCTYESLSGTNVKRDFVELPSQIMENWAWEKEWLDMWAAHYQTGEKIPEEILHKLRQSLTYNEGYASMRQISFALLDMAWHTVREEFKGDIIAMERVSMGLCEMLPTVDDVSMSCSFGHLFSGGYAAGYYGYKWAEVLDADAYSLFREKGIFDKETAASFRKNILEKGGSHEPDELFISFRGREPRIEALIERCGFKKQ